MWDATIIMIVSIVIQVHLCCFMLFSSGQSETITESTLPLLLLSLHSQILIRSYLKSFQHSKHSIVCACVFPVAHTLSLVKGPQASLILRHWHSATGGLNINSVGSLPHGRLAWPSEVHYGSDGLMTGSLLSGCEGPHCLNAVTVRVGRGEWMRVPHTERVNENSTTPSRREFNRPVVSSHSLGQRCLTTVFLNCG